jgi:hypothetical protein
MRTTGFLAMVAKEGSFHACNEARIKRGKVKAQTPTAQAPRKFQTSRSSFMGGNADGHGFPRMSTDRKGCSLRLEI